MLLIDFKFQQSNGVERPVDCGGEKHLSESNDIDLLKLIGGEFKDNPAICAGIH
jgi:hypothetical protein